jgi:hypothetical protein
VECIPELKDLPIVDHRNNGCAILDSQSAEALVAGAQVHGWLLCAVHITAIEQFCLSTRAKRNVLTGFESMLEASFCYLQASRGLSALLRQVRLKHKYVHSAATVPQCAHSFRTQTENVMAAHVRSRLGTKAQQLLTAQ